MKNLVIGLVMIAQAAYAGPLLEKATSMSRLSSRISTVAEQIEFGNSGPAAKRRLKLTLDQMISQAQDMQALLGGQTLPHPLPTTPARIRVIADCHVDDDQSFDYDQESFPVKGSSVEEVISVCKEMAAAMYPGPFHSTGIKNVRSTGRNSAYTQSAVCHIDDDQSFDFDQLVIGTLLGETLQEIGAQCELIAKDAYGIFGSAAVKDINQDTIIPRNAMSATCHIDDDHSMDFDQFVMGTVYGATIAEMAKDCRALAKNAFGVFGSSALKDIQQ